jgi:hypothetical protein
MSSAGGDPSWQAMVSVGTSIVPPGPRPPLADTPGTSPAVTTSQVTASIHDFAGSLGHERIFLSTTAMHNYASINRLSGRSWDCGTAADERGLLLAVPTRYLALAITGQWPTVQA